MRRWQESPSNYVHSPIRSGQPIGIQRCYVVYINLEHRSDRRQSFQTQMETLDVAHFRRFEAVRAQPGGLGCSMSHDRVLSSWSPVGDQLLMVCEDDALFLASRPEIDEIIEEFAADPRLSVLALANSTPWRIPISDRLAISSDIQTTACYVAKASAVPGLIRSAQASMSAFAAKKRYAAAAIDQVWKTYQHEVFFAVPRNRAVIQMPGESDIEGGWRRYNA